MKQTLIGTLPELQYIMNVKLCKESATLTACVVRCNLLRISFTLMLVLVRTLRISRCVLLYYQLYKKSGFEFVAEKSIKQTFQMTKRNTRNLSEACMLQCYWT